MAAAVGNPSATMSAAQAVGEFLQSPDDLLKVVAFRKKLEKEKASIDTRLKSGVKDQLDATREGLRKLFSTRTHLQSIKDEMQVVDSLCSDPKNSVSTFDQISRVSMVHRNFERTEELVNNLLEMNARVGQLEEMLYEDTQDILGPATNLLAIHYQINQLESFRNETTSQAKKASAESKATLAKWFERLNKIISVFDAYILDLAQNILPLVRAHREEVVIKLIKIAEVEGKADERAAGILLVMRAKKNSAAKFKNMAARTRVIKNYRTKILQCIKDSIREKFKDAYENDRQNPTGFLENIGWMYQDIIRIESDVVKCFPASWKIYEMYIKEYHKTLDETIRRIVSDEPEASALLALHAWLKEYKENMKELNIPQEFIRPPLLDGKEQSLIDDYLGVIVKKLDEWSENLMKTEVEAFIQRRDPPELDADGMYGTQGAVILFQMINQQVDLAMESGQGAILARVITDVDRVMRGIQDQWTKVIDSEFKKQVEKPEEVPGGLVEYCIALANDQVKCADYAEALSARIEPLVSEKYRVVINERLNDAIDGHLDVAKKCTQTLINMIFNDLKPATKQLFQPPWYDGIITQVIDTVKDYTSDYNTYLSPTLFELLIADLLDTFVVTYLTALANAPKLRLPAATDRIRADIDAAFRFFGAYKKSQELQGDFEVVEMILAMLEASKSLVFLSYWSFAKVHGPNVAFVESLMKCRGDFDRSAVSEVMDSVKRKVKEENLQDPEEPTIMKKISVQGIFYRFLRNN